jgi:hypothetical protein
VSDQEVIVDPRSHSHSTVILASNKIRNIVQTAQEREIIKTAPDMVVYIDALPFINNPYLSQGSTNLVAVNFNDYITAISTSYSIDSFMPSGTINLSVPNGSKQLFMAPGGNTIIDIMSAVRIYAKGYFYSPDGNTVFRRIFNGLIKSVALTETPTSLEISIGIVGICRLLEITQIELNRAIISASNSLLTVFRTNQSSLNIYGALYDTFHRGIDFSEFLQEAFQQKLAGSNQDRDKLAISKEYATKWATNLQDLCRDVRLFGWSSANNAISSPVVSGDTNALMNSSIAVISGAAPSVLKKQTEMCKENAAIISLIHNYSFDMSLASLKLFGSQLVSRLERIRYLTEIMGFEGYQDVDGLIIIKPPLYNLDCTIVGDSTSAPASGSLVNDGITSDTNPFIIHMSEILSENYQEDEAAIIKTSMSITANFNNPSGYQIAPPTEYTKVSRFTDVNLVRKFGVRQEPAKAVGFLHNDMRATYGFCAAELAKANRGFTTYTVSIPLRPELRLGFTVYFPHKDIYAYITGIAMSYNVGGQATTSITCNFVRKRPLFLQTQNTSQVINGVNTPTTIQVFAAQPNLVHAFTTASATQYDPNSGNVLSESGTISSVPLVPSGEPDSTQRAVYNYLTQKLGGIYETWTDQPANTSTPTWRIQNDGGSGPNGTDGTKVPFPKNKSGNSSAPDSTNTWYNGGLDAATGTIFSAPKVADGNYIDRTTMVQPYTNEKGYEVISPFPWGRYATLTDALATFTRNDGWPESQIVAPTSSTSIAISAFLTAGLTTSTTPSSPAYQLAVLTPPLTVQNTLSSQDTLVTSTFPFQRFDKTNVPYFELAYSDGDVGVTETNFAIPNWSSPNNGSGTVSGAPGASSAVSQSSSSSALQTWSNSVDALQVFLQGYIGPTNSNNVGPYAVSTLPQNTDIGGYAPPNGPLSGVLLSMGATFTRSPYGAILGLRPTGATQNPAYTTGTNATYTGDSLGQTLTNIGQIISGGG